MITYLVAGSLCALFFSGIHWMFTCMAFIFGVLSFRTFIKDGEKEAKKKAIEDEIWRKEVAIANENYERILKTEAEELIAWEKEVDEWI